MAKFTFCGISPCAFISLRKFNFARDDPDEIAVLVEQRTAGVARLDRRGNLVEAAVVADPGERRHDAGGEVAARRENLAQRIAERFDILPQPGAEPKRSHARRLGVDFQERQIVGRIFGDEFSDLEVSLPHPDPNIEAILHDVGVGDEVALVGHENAGA